MRPRPAARGGEPSVRSDSNAPRWVSDWAPVVLWMAVIFVASGDSFAAARTEGWLAAALRIVFDDVTAEGLRATHAIVRKTAHFVEYAILGGLAYRAAGRSDPGAGPGRWAARALALAVAWAVVDEVHQLWVPGRTGALSDVLIDAAGACAGLGVAARTRFAVRMP